MQIFYRILKGLHWIDVGPFPDKERARTDMQKHALPEEKVFGPFEVADNYVGDGFEVY